MGAGRAAAARRPAAAPPVAPPRPPCGCGRCAAGLDCSLMSTTLVLAVDDEPALLKITEHALKQGGYAVLTFDDARDALEEMRDGLRPDVIVSDIHMPAMTGFEFYEHVRQIGELGPCRSCS
jgi:SpoU rRNA methylase family enzyme